MTAVLVCGAIALLGLGVCVGVLVGRWWCRGSVYEVRFDRPRVGA